MDDDDDDDDILTVTFTLEINRKDKKFRWVTTGMKTIEDETAVFEAMNTILELSRRKSASEDRMVH